MVMTKCPHCKELKSGGEMAFFVKRPQPYRYWCGACWRASDAYRERQKIYARNYNQRPTVKRRRKHHIPVRDMVQKALKNKIITKPLLCFICGKERPLDGHHDNYKEPLNIKWICRQCHHDIHLQKKANKVLTKMTSIIEKAENRIQIRKGQSSQ